MFKIFIRNLNIIRHTYKANKFILKNIYQIILLNLLSLYYHNKQK